MVPLSEPCIGGHEWDYVKECLDTGWVSSVGPFVSRLEQWGRNYASAQGAVAVASGTAALHIALMLAGVRPADEVILPAITFIAPAYAVHYVGADPVFVDADPEFWQLDPVKVADFLRGCRREGGQCIDPQTGRPVTAIIAVHVLGHPCDMDPIMSLAREFRLTVIEDATESLGSLYRQRRTGLLGDIGCLSFNGNKIVTAGGGGLILTRDAAQTERARYLTTQAKDDPVEYVHGEIGFNYRLTNVQAAIGLAQVERLPEFVAAKRRLAATYADGLAGVSGISIMPEAPWATSNRWLSAILVDPAAYGHDSRWLLRRLDEAAIQTRPLWQPLHRSPAFAAPGGPAQWVADSLNRDALCLPSSVTLAEHDQSRIIDIIASSADGRG